MHMGCAGLSMAAGHHLPARLGCGQPAPLGAQQFNQRPALVGTSWSSLLAPFIVASQQDQYGNVHIVQQLQGLQRPLLNSLIFPGPSSRDCCQCVVAIKVWPCSQWAVSGHDKSSGWPIISRQPTLGRCKATNDFTTYHSLH